MTTFDENPTARVHFRPGRKEEAARCSIELGFDGVSNKENKDLSVIVDPKKKLISVQRK